MRHCDRRTRGRPRRRPGIVETSPTDGAIAHAIGADGPSTRDLIATAGWLDDPSSPSIELPDLRGVDGWRQRYAWTEGEGWTVTAIGDSGGLAAEALIGRIGQTPSSTADLDGVDRSISDAWPDLRMAPDPGIG